jgi:hypothetical protein
MKKLNITIPLIICLFALSSCTGCGAGWSKARTEKAQLDELEKQTVALQKIADELSGINTSLQKSSPEITP